MILSYFTNWAMGMKVMCSSGLIVINDSLIKMIIMHFSHFSAVPRDSVSGDWLFNSSVIADSWRVINKCFSIMMKVDSRYDFSVNIDVSVSNLSWLSSISHALNTSASWL